MTANLKLDWNYQPLEQPVTVTLTDTDINASLSVKRAGSELLEVLIEVEALAPNAGRPVMHVYFKDQTGGEDEPAFSYWLDTGELRTSSEHPQPQEKS